jgi:L-lactate dehydrogenase
VLPVSSLIEDFHGMSDVCFSMPSVVSRTGAEPPLPVPLNENELAGLRNSAETIQKSIRSLGF